MNFINSTALVIIVLASVLVFMRIDKPFIGQHDWNGVVYGQEAKNFLRYGYFPLKLGAAQLPGDKPIEDQRFATHYSPALPILISFSYRLFGVSELTTRLVPSLASVLSVLLIISIGNKLFRNQWIGVIAGTLASLTPMFIYYGKNPVHEVVQLPFSLLAFYSYLQWTSRKDRIWWWLLVVSLVAVMMVGWQGYYITWLIGLHGIMFSKNKSRFLTLPILSGILFSVFLWHISILDSFSLSGLWQVAASRLGGMRIPIGDFLRRELRFSINLFTGTMLFLSGWGIYLIRDIKRQTLLLFMGVFGVAHVLIFREAGWYHEYLLFPVLPFLSISAASSIMFLVSKLNGRVFKAAVVISILMIVGAERVRYASALLSSEYVRDVYQEAVQFSRVNKGQGVSIPEERDVFFIYYADRKDI